MTFKRASELCGFINKQRAALDSELQMRLNINTYFDIKETKFKYLFHYENRNEYFFGDVLIVIDPNVKDKNILIERRHS